MTTDTLLRTPFHSLHVSRGAKLVEFAGWEMPMLYGSIIEEHRQVRTSGGLFDVSHMGRLRFTGSDARRFLDRVCTRQIHGMADGQARYSLVCNAAGGCRDDVLVYRLADAEYLMVCNAANRTKLLGHFDAERGDLDFTLRDETTETGMIALQGPKVMDLIGGFAPEVPQLKRYRFLRQDVMGADVLISRTGYTGEDGVEIILPGAIAETAVAFLAGNMDGPDAPIQPAGLGARDSLRLEAAMPLYGHEITEEIDPLSAGLNFAVKLDKAADDESMRSFHRTGRAAAHCAEGPGAHARRFRARGAPHGAPGHGGPRRRGGGRHDHQRVPESDARQANRNGPDRSSAQRARNGGRHRPWRGHGCIGR